MQLHNNSFTVLNDTERNRVIRKFEKLGNALEAASSSKLFAQINGLNNELNQQVTRTHGMSLGND